MGSRLALSCLGLGNSLLLASASWVDSACLLAAWASLLSVTDIMDTHQVREHGFYSIAIIKLRMITKLNRESRGYTVEPLLTDTPEKRTPMI